MDLDLGGYATIAYVARGARECERNLAPPLHLKAFRIPGLFGSLLLASAQLTTLGAQQSPCDPSLLRSTQDRNGYRQRGDRCEGVYIQAVASPALRVISFTESFENFDPASGTSLRVEWDSPPARGPVHLRGNALRPHLYYRFDAIRPPDSTGTAGHQPCCRPSISRKPELALSPGLRSRLVVPPGMYTCLFASAKGRCRPWPSNISSSWFQERSSLRCF